MNLVPMFAFRGLCGAIGCAVCLMVPQENSPAGEQTETARFLRPSGAEWVFESEIQLRQTKNGMVVKSVTGRDKSKLELVARFDRATRLLEAEVTTQRGDEKQSASVAVTEGKARVTRHDGNVKELDCPGGVIVTSAPDWTDAFVMLRRYDRTRGDKQEFPGLWIHPVQEPLRPTFSLTRLGADTVEREGMPQSLDRFRVVLRGGSRYIGWSDAHGKLIRLAPENAPRQGIVLEGWEKTAGTLSVEPAP